MDTGERLAAYLSGDLDTDERTALEADLAGDGALRARLERIRAADDALAGLPEVDVPEGFSARLRARVAPEVDEVLGDELAARRARRATPSWLPALGAAAALAVVVAGGITLSGGMGGSDDAATGAGEEGARTMMDDGGAGAADTQMQGDAEASAPAGPTVTNRGRTLGLDDLRELPNDPDVQAALGGDPTQGNPQAAADEFASALDQQRAPGATAEAEADGDAGDDAATESAPMPQDLAGPGVALRGDVSDADLDAIAACLPVLSEEAADPVVPLYVELATDEDGDAVIVYAALAADADGEYRRVEIWMVDRESCDLRQFVQQDL